MRPSLPLLLLPRRRRPSTSLTLVSLLPPSLPSTHSREQGAPTTKKGVAQKKNPLRNRAVLFRMNPYAATQKRIAHAKEAAAKKDGHKKSGAKQPLERASKEFKATLLSA